MRRSPDFLLALTGFMVVYEVGVYDGAAAIINRAHTRTDNLNLTNIWDNVVAANHQSFWYTATNRLQNAGGPWGDLTFYYDGVGNRTYRILDDAGVTATQTFGYPGSSNLIGDEDVGGTTTRTFTHDAAGNMTKDVRVADTYDYAINHAGRISQVKINSVVSADYKYNAQNQLVFRSTTVAGGPLGDMHYVYDRAGRLIAEADAATGTTVREYIRLADMPIAVVADVDTASPVIYYVHVDHLNRPVMMTDGLKANVWEAVWLPFGAIHSITGTASNDARFPGQWFQIETGLHYNWHRHYDPTLARYTQPDPLGFVDGPSVFAYAKNSPQVYIDRDGRAVLVPLLVGLAVGGAVDFGLQYLEAYLEGKCFVWDKRRTGLAAFAGALGGGFGGFISTRGLGLLHEAIVNAWFNGLVGGSISQATGGDPGWAAALGGLGGTGGALLGRGLGAVARGFSTGLGQGLASGLADAFAQIGSNAISGAGGLLPD